MWCAAAPLTQITPEPRGLRHVPNLDFFVLEDAGSIEQISVDRDATFVV
jgi:hypothetical protein